MSCTSPQAWQVFDDRVGHQDNSVVAFRGLVDRCPRAVRDVAARENNCIAPGFTQMPLEFGAVEGTTPGLCKAYTSTCSAGPTCCRPPSSSNSCSSSTTLGNGSARSGIQHCPVRRFAHPALPSAVAQGRRSNRPGGTTGRRARSAAEIHGRLSPTWPLPESPQVFPQCASENRPHKNHAACRSAPMLPIPQLDAYSFLRASWLLARVEFKR